ncbi:hypothetical protein CEXT_439861 [Caerostris extrusa]|uniref:Uncharacterized protein n=1 Tax=Caerostris extrusa TaxID=172846 RepID=A0AAV4YB33_CAEEX|nr:hypothetical protein CEXT_439861 [Caerostris extrusa]
MEVKGYFIEPHLHANCFASEEIVLVNFRGNRGVGIPEGDHRGETETEMETEQRKHKGGIRGTNSHAENCVQMNAHLRWLVVPVKTNHSRDQRYSRS